MIIYTEYTIFKACSRRRSIPIFKVSDGNIKIKGQNGIVIQQKIYYNSAFAKGLFI